MDFSILSQPDPQCNSFGYANTSILLQFYPMKPHRLTWAVIAINVVKNSLIG